MPQGCGGGLRARRPAAALRRCVTSHPRPAVPPPCSPSGYETRVNGTGASSCSACQPGSFASLPNTPICSKCAPATFSPTPGAKACKLCPAGQVSGPLPGDPKAGGAGEGPARAARAPAAPSGPPSTPPTCGEQVTRALASTCGPCKLRALGPPAALARWPCHPSPAPHPAPHAAAACAAPPAAKRVWTRAPRPALPASPVPRSLTPPTSSAGEWEDGWGVGGGWCCAGQPPLAAPAPRRPSRRSSCARRLPCVRPPAACAARAPTLKTRGAPAPVSCARLASTSPTMGTSCATPARQVRAPWVWPRPQQPPLRLSTCKRRGGKLRKPAPRSRPRPTPTSLCLPTGTYQNATGALECISCPVGTYSEVTGAKELSNCKPAPPGNYAEGVGNDGFTPCLPGTYQDLPGQGACKDCPPGSACPRGSVRPKDCSPGFYADLKQPFCRECPRGTFQNLARQRACKPCPAGAYCPNNKTVTPTLCPAGTYSVKLSGVTMASCVKCSINVRTFGRRRHCQPALCVLWRRRKPGPGPTACPPTQPSRLRPASPCRPLTASQGSAPAHAAARGSGLGA